MKVKDREDLDQVIHLLRCYYTAAHATQEGMQQLRSPEQLVRLEQRLAVASAAADRLEEELNQLLTDLQTITHTQQTRLDQARQRSEQRREPGRLVIPTHRVPGPSSPRSDDRIEGSS
jgi:uncharacterized damage-inducible protein DinB